MNISQLLESIGFNKPVYLGVDLEPPIAILVLLKNQSNLIDLTAFTAIELPSEAFNKNEVIDPKLIGRTISESSQFLVQHNLYSVISAPAKTVTTAEVKIPIEQNELK